MKNNKEKINKEKGFTMIEHELYNWTIKTKKLGKPEMRIVHAIIRKTNGYHRKKARISLRYFEVLTGVDHRNVGTYLKTLVKKRIINRHREDEDENGQPAYSYSINKKCYRLGDYSDADDSNGEYNTPAIKTAPEPAVKSMSNKNIKNKKTRDNVKILMNYTEYRKEQDALANENKKDDSKTKNSASEEK